MRTRSALLSPLALALLPAVFTATAAAQEAGEPGGPGLALRARKVPFGFVNAMPAVFDQPESRRQLLGETGLRSVALDGDLVTPIDLSPPPRLNEHGDAILKELGYDEASRRGLLDA